MIFLRWSLKSGMPYHQSAQGILSERRGAIAPLPNRGS
jgi:hypothetical protein